MYIHVNDMVGKRFGKLVVLRRVEDGKFGQYRFLCKCDCGREHTTDKSSLTRETRNARSCGCLKAERRVGVSNFPCSVMRTELETVCPKCPSKLQQRVLSIKKNGISRGKERSITDAQILCLILMPCTYCGYLDQENGIGIDRVDSLKGYSLDNCVPCCKTCNFAKNNQSLSDFSLWLERVSNYFL